MNASALLGVGAATSGDGDHRPSMKNDGFDDLMGALMGTLMTPPPVPPKPIPMPIPVTLDFGWSPRPTPTGGPSQLPPKTMVPLKALVPPKALAQPKTTASAPVVPTKMVLPPLSMDLSSPLSFANDAIFEAMVKTSASDNSPQTSTTAQKSTSQQQSGHHRFNAQKLVLASTDTPGNTPDSAAMTGSTEAPTASTVSRSAAVMMEPVATPVVIPLPPVAMGRDGVVRVEIDAHLAVEISQKGDGVEVLLEGAAKSVEPLRDIGTELRNALEMGGFSLSSFDTQDREETSDQETLTAPVGSDTEGARRIVQPMFGRGASLQIVA